MIRVRNHSVVDETVVPVSEFSAAQFAIAGEGVKDVLEGATPVPIESRIKRKTLFHYVFEILLAHFLSDGSVNLVVVDVELLGKLMDHHEFILNYI